MIIKFLFILYLGFSFSALARTKSYKIKVFSEPGSEDQAQEFIQQLGQLEPFKQLITKNIIILQPKPEVVDDLNCKGGLAGVERLAVCNLKTVEKKCDADLCPIYTKVPNIGAGGKRYPIISASFPWTSMLHEVVHTFDFSDEYAYTTAETKIYCKEPTSWQNAYSQQNTEVFSTKEAALRACKEKIPWCSFAISEGSTVIQQIENGKFIIGSPTPEKCPSTKIGVYLGGACQDKNPKSTWRPYFCPTIMGFPQLGEDYCAVKKRHKIIESAPNLLPTYYQKMIFEKIISIAKISETIPQKTQEPSYQPHIYGIPQLDKMAGENGDLNFCLDNEND
jgi:hypothetical protein